MNEAYDIDLASLLEGIVAIAAGDVRITDLTLDSRAVRPGWQGFLTHLSNPKAVLFWTALLPQFLDPAAPVTRQIVLLGLLGMVIDAVVLSAYAASAAAARHSLLTRSVRHWIDLAAGVFFVVAGILLALAHRGA